MDIKPYTRKANYYETDQMGVIHHSNYIRWFEEARVDFMEQLGFGYGRAVEQGLDLALLAISCEYKSMVRFGDTVRIYVTVSALESMSMTVSYRVEDAADGNLRTLGESRHCYFDNVRKRPVPLARKCPELFRLFEEMV